MSSAFSTFCTRRALAASKLLANTLAVSSPQVSLGDKFFSRPALRAFVTYASWSDGLEGKVGGADYINSTDGWSWGVQMETWW